MGAIGSTTTVVEGLTAQCGTAVAVRLRAFAARRRANGVEVRWRTASEVDTLGYNVYRSVAGKRLKVNRRLIPARSLVHGTVTGSSYAYLDRQAPRKRAIRYWLQIVDRNGVATWEGPASVRAGGANS